MNDFSLLSVNHCELEVGVTGHIFDCKRNCYRYMYKFRRGIVPYTGKYSGGSYYRTPRTFQESRMSLACNSQFIRSSRNIRNLPTCWDDIKIASLYNYNWKKFGKKRKSWDK